MAGTSEAIKTKTAEAEIALRPGADAVLGDGNVALLEGQAESAPGAEIELRDGSSVEWPVVDWLPIVLTVTLPLPTFRVRDLLSLEVGTVVTTAWPNGDDLPLSAGTVQLAWVDMETVEQSMAVRLTRLL